MSKSPSKPIENGSSGDKDSSLKDDKNGESSSEQSIDYISYFLLGICIMITIFAFPSDLCKGNTRVQLIHVFYYGWITAISTGLGVVPFFFLREPNKFWMAISNAVAGGMMLSASFSLANEGMVLRYDAEFGILSYLDVKEENLSLIRTIAGALLGIVFIIGMQKWLDKYEDLNVSNIGGSGAQKTVLILFVMTLHSLTEGIGIGVSFGGKSGMQLGKFISLSLAVHNVPEGLAVGLVLTSKKVSKLKSVLWAIFTSVPQPIFAIPAFLFIEKFAPLLPLGLGFAAGAMTYVAVYELLAEAVEDSGLLTTSFAGTIAYLLMGYLQTTVKAMT